MASDDQYLSYEQVLQELQVNRSQLNRFIREGRLTEHVVEGETKFRLAEVTDIKRSMEKSPTVMEEEQAGEPATDLLDEGEEPAGKEPATEMLGEEKPATELLGEEKPTDAAARETVVLEDGRPPQVADRDTEILEEDELELELPEDDEASASAGALETDLELQPAGAGKDEDSGEDFFDFTDALADDEIELEATPGEEPMMELELEGPETQAEDEEIVTDILDLSAEEDVAEEDLLSEIMDIEEEPEAGGLTAESTEDITAEITTLEEPTYEDSDLGAVLEIPEEEEMGAEFGAEADFAVPYAEPIVASETRAGGLFVFLLVATLIVMGLALVFAVENSVHPDFSTGLTSWAAGISS